MDFFTTNGTYTALTDYQQFKWRKKLKEIGLRLFYNKKAIDGDPFDGIESCSFGE